jgi:hypothetical protein
LGKYRQLPPAFLDSFGVADHMDEVASIDRHREPNVGVPSGTLIILNKGGLSCVHNVHP